MSAVSAASEAQLRLVVYCDQEKEPVRLPTVASPHSLKELRELLERSTKRQSKLISYWNYSTARYDPLEHVGQLHQEAALDQSGETKQKGDAKGQQIPTYSAQLWLESALLVLVPVDPHKDRSEFAELANHVHQRMGNKYVVFDLHHAARVQYPYLSRKFDQTRRDGLHANREDVRLLYYTNNAWGTTEALQYGFVLRGDVPARRGDVATAVLLGEPGAQQDSRGGGADGTSDRNNTLCNPFCFSSSMLNPDDKKAAMDVKQKVLLCEVAPGRMWLSGVPLTRTGVRVTPPEGYDSLYYDEDTNLRDQRPKAMQHTRQLPRLTQMRVTTSHQALPRYVLTVLPRKRDEPSKGPRPYELTSQPVSEGFSVATPPRSSGRGNIDSPAPTYSAAVSPHSTHARSTDPEAARGSRSSTARVRSAMSTPQRWHGTAEASATPTGHSTRTNRVVDLEPSTSSTVYTDAPTQPSQPRAAGISSSAVSRADVERHPRQLHEPSAVLALEPALSDWQQPLAQPREPRRQPMPFPRAQQPLHPCQYPHHDEEQYPPLMATQGSSPLRGRYSNPDTGHGQQAPLYNGGYREDTIHQEAPMAPGRRNVRFPPGNATYNDRAADPRGQAAQHIPQQQPYRRAERAVGGSRPPLLPTVGPPAVSLLCVVHPQQMTALHCVTCDELVCPYCASVGIHGGHEVEEAHSHATRVRTRLQDLCHDLSQWRDHFQRVEQQLRVEQTEAQRQYRQRVLTLRGQFAEVRKALDRRERSLMKQLDEQVALLSPPLEEACEVRGKYERALAPLERSLRTYQSSQDQATVRQDQRSSLTALLHFVRTAPQLIADAKIFFRLSGKVEETRLATAVDTVRNANTRVSGMLATVNVEELRQRVDRLGEQQKRPAARHSSAPTPDAKRISTPYFRTQSHISVRDATSPPPSSWYDRWSTRTSPVRDATLPCPPTPTTGTTEGGTQTKAHSGYRVGPLMARCLLDLQRGHIWTIQNASQFFSPGQNLAVCSTPFRLLGLQWELRIVAFSSVMQSSSVATHDSSLAEGVGLSPAAGSSTPAATTGGGLAARCDPQEISFNAASFNSDPSTPLVRQTTTLIGFSSSAGVGDSLEVTTEEQWLGLFLFPVRHSMRLDFRLIAFSEVSWTEWKVIGWPEQLSGKGWGLFPFLKRKDLMRTDKLARDNCVKICLAPISDPY